MMFKKLMAQKIRSREKTETRRLTSSKRKYREGSFQPIQENYYECAKDHVLILKRWTQRLCEMTAENLQAEGGFKTLDAYIGYLREIHRKGTVEITPNLEVTAYKFDYVPPGFKDLLLRAKELMA